MKSKRLLLLRTLLTASGNKNVLKYGKDAKKKSSVRGNIIGLSLVYFVFALYCAATSIGLGTRGLYEAIPSMCATILISISFIFTLLKTNGYLFGFREYDMLISMPFEIRDVVAAKFLYMYIKSMPMLCIMSAAMYVGYALGKGFGVVELLFWVILTLALPLLPMALASALGAVAVRLTSGFRYKKILQTIMIFIFVIPCFFMRFIIEKIFKDDRAEAVLNQVAEGFDNASGYVPMAKWFEKAINDGSILYFLLIIAASAFVNGLFIILVSRSFRRMNSRLSSSAAHKKYRMGKQKKRSMVKSIAYKEFKRMTGSTNYFVNAAMGEVLCIILAIAALIVDPESIIAVVTNGAPVSPSMLVPAVPVLVFMLVGMVATTCCSPSLEGKNYWIMQSLPISKETDMKGKLLFNMYLAFPVGLITSIILSLRMGADLFETLLGCLALFVMCLFSSLFGLRCGLKHRKLDWDNDIEVVKQGAGVASYLFPVLFSNMFLVVGAVAANLYINSVILVELILILSYGLLSGLSYLGCRKYLYR